MNARTTRKKGASVAKQADGDKTNRSSSAPTLYHEDFQNEDSMAAAQLRPEHAPPSWPTDLTSYSNRQGLLDAYTALMFDSMEFGLAMRPLRVLFDERHEDLIKALCAQELDDSASVELLATMARLVDVARNLLGNRPRQSTTDDGNSHAHASDGRSTPAERLCQEPGSDCELSKSAKATKWGLH